MTREDRDREIDDHVAYLDALYARVRGPAGRSAARVTVLGFSQGVATVCRWLARGAARAHRLIIWGGRMPGDLFPLPAESPLRSVRLVVVVGSQDQWLTADVLAEQEALLRGAGLAYELRQFTGGHAVDAAELREIAAEKGSLAEKAKAAGKALKDPGAKGPDPEAAQARPSRARRRRKAAPGAKPESEGPATRSK
jgi:predicted esterase